MTRIKRLVLILIVLAMPVIWLWATRDRSNEPPPEPTASSAAATIKKMKHTRTPPLGQQVVIETSKGTIVVALYDQDAKVTTKNFISLVNRKFYNGLIFHRVEPGFVIQTGDPTGTGAGGSGKTIPLETSPTLLHNSPGVLGMARADDPNSASSQFYITLRATPDLDGRYAVFGKVVSGMDVVQKIVKGDKVKKAYACPPNAPVVPNTMGT